MLFQLDRSSLYSYSVFFLQAPPMILCKLSFQLIGFAESNRECHLATSSLGNVDIQISRSLFSISSSNKGNLKLDLTLISKASSHLLPEWANIWTWERGSFLQPTTSLWPNYQTVIDPDILRGCVRIVAFTLCY